MKNKDWRALHSRAITKQPEEKILKIQFTSISRQNGRTDAVAQRTFQDFFPNVEMQYYCFSLYVLINSLTEKFVAMKLKQRLKMIFNVTVDTKCSI